MSWWDDYKKAFLKGINPADSIGDQISYHTQQIPGPQIPTPPTPERWYNNAAPHPLFPQPPGAPPSFSGPVFPNSNNVRPLPDTQTPAEPIQGGTASVDNFKGQVPLRRLMGRGATIKVE
jgi:hypothetical protein